MNPEQARQIVDRVAENVRKVVLGKDAVIGRAIACWLGGGHLLLEDVPGTGKTILARALARSVQADTKRIQLTPDLMPSDIVGTSLFSREKNGFVFVPGPIFTTVLLADELNRATPRTQSALLQAMAEGQVTAENHTYTLPGSFFVIATQNPSDQHGTFPLPEAQLDRFMMRLSVGYPCVPAEKQMVRAQLLRHPIEDLSAVATDKEWATVRNLTREVQVSEATLAYAVGLVQATREDERVAVGCSPRATIALVRSAQAFALMTGEPFVKPDFIKHAAPAVLTHRLILTPRARLAQIDAEGIVREILGRVPVPVRADLAS